MRTQPVALELAQQRRAVGGGERRLELRHALADARTERAEVRLHLVGDVLVGLRDEAHLVDVQLVAHRAPRARAARRSSAGSGEHDLGRRERLAHVQLAARCAPGGRATRARAPRASRARARSSIAGASASGQSARCTLSRRARAERAAHEVLLHLLGEEGQERREQARQRRQALVERPVRVELVGLEARPPRSARGCGARTSSRARRRGRSARRSPRRRDRRPCARVAARVVSASSERIQRSSSARARAPRGGPRGSAGIRRIEAVDVRVDGEERVDVAQLERELLLRRAHVRERVARLVPGRVRRVEEPAERVGAGRGRAGIVDQDRASRRRPGTSRGRICAPCGAGVDAEPRRVRGREHDHAPRQRGRRELELERAPRRVAAVDAHLRAARRAGRAPRSPRARSRARARRGRAASARATAANSMRTRSRITSGGV